MMFAEVAFKYCDKTGITADQNPQFIFNSQSIPFDSCKTLSELHLSNGARIDVVIGKAVIGAI